MMCWLDRKKEVPTSQRLRSRMADRLLRRSSVQTDEENLTEVSKNF